jgi:hypothetical protein
MIFTKDNRDMTARFTLVASFGLAIGFTYSVFLSITTSFLFVPSFAQDTEDPVTEDPARLNGADEEQPRLDTTDSDMPVLENVSEKGIFRVQLRWPEVPLNPQGAFQVQAVFLNASAPDPSPESIPQSRANLSGQSPTDTGMFVIPGAIERRVPVTSYDMTILSAEGKELWKQINRPGSGGSAGERIILEDEYYGPVTIVIDNIIPGWDVASSIDDDPILASEGEEIRDSVTFTARVIPEFPFYVMLPLVVGTSLMIIAMRIRSRYRF